MYEINMNKKENAPEHFKMETKFIFKVCENKDKHVLTRLPA